MEPSVVEKAPSSGTVSIKLAPGERGRIAALASLKKRTPHYLMREAILDYVSREESRLNFIAAAESSFEHYKQTGLHVTLGEFSTWVDTIQETADTPMPVCHK
jgi:predicted transcriptional regulator